MLSLYQRDFQLLYDIIHSLLIGSMWTLLQALAAAGSRAEYLGAQVSALEQELKSRDSLLLEIKAETKRSKEALTVAAQIKQVALAEWIAS